ncbi:hypothetical protein ACEWX3_05440 [Mycobacterium sp. G7A2]|uniref:hypothetical protein n=1 Tax=Mycobacterium sp. G7A2 TaxID=3317307 RepID=UPI0035A882F3
MLYGRARSTIDLSGVAFALILDRFCELRLGIVEADEFLCNETFFAFIGNVDIGVEVTVTVAVNVVIEAGLDTDTS